MKKLTGGSKSIYYSPIHLYKDDIENIIDILKEISKDIHISDDEYAYDSIEEIINKRGLNPRKINIGCHSPYIDLGINNKDTVGATYLYCSNQDKESLYALDRILEILRKRRKFLSRIFNPTCGIFYLGLFFYLFWFTKARISDFIIQNNWTFTLLTFLILLLLALPFGFRFLPVSSILLLRPHEQHNFFIRQKDDLIKILISAIAGAVIGAIITKLFTKC